MVTYFNTKDLTRFGEYLLSDERTKRIKESYDDKDNISLDERLKAVYHADYENFMDSLRKTK